MNVNLVAKINAHRLCNKKKKNEVMFMTYFILLADYYELSLYYFPAKEQPRNNLVRRSMQKSLQTPCCCRCFYCFPPKGKNLVQK